MGNFKSNSRIPEACALARARDHVATKYTTISDQMPNTENKNNTINLTGTGACPVVDARR